MTRLSEASRRVANWWDRFKFGKPLTVEIHSDATDGMTFFVQRRFRNAVERHGQETGLFVVGGFRTHGDGPDRPSLRVRTGRLQESKHVSWRLQESSRTRTTWKSWRPVAHRSLRTGLVSQPRMIPLRPGEMCLVQVRYSSALSFDTKEFELQLHEGSKKLIFVTAADGIAPPSYELRDI